LRNEKNHLEFSEHAQCIVLKKKKFKLKIFINREKIWNFSENMATEVVSNNLTNSNDRLNGLMKEAETLKQRLEEERQKLNDVTCK
jgi:hypothetical protein